LIQKVVNVVIIVDLLVDDGEWVGCLRDVIYMIIEYTLFYMIRKIYIACNRRTQLFTLMQMSSDAILLDRLVTTSRTCIKCPRHI